MYTWWLVLPVMAMPTPEPELDPTLITLRAQFIRQVGLVELQRREEGSGLDSGYMSPTAGFGSRAYSSSTRGQDHHSALGGEENDSAAAGGSHIPRGEGTGAISPESNPLTEYAYHITGDVFSLHGLKSAEMAQKYELPPEGSHQQRVGNLIIQTPSSNYLQQKGLYHGYRLLVGDGYVVPSMLVQFKKNGSLSAVSAGDSPLTSETASSSTEASPSSVDSSPLFWLIEVMPYVQTSTPLVDLRDKADSHSLGVHLLSSMLFNTSSASYAQTIGLGAANRSKASTQTPRSAAAGRSSSSSENQTTGGGSSNPLSTSATESVQRVLTSTDTLEGEITPDLLGLNKKVVPKGLKHQLSQVTLQRYIPYWLQTLSTAMDRAKALGYREDLTLQLNTAFALASRLHKLSGLLSSPYDMTYEDVHKMMGKTTRTTSDQEPRSLKEITLLSLYDLFFKHRSSDWTQVFEIVGETFPSYAPYFDKQKHLYTDINLLQQALNKNRTSAVLTFMQEGGLRADTLTQNHILHKVVHLSGRKLDTDKATQWIQALSHMGLNLEEQDAKGNTALDIALQQHKEQMIISLINAGAGSRVKPSYILDYLKARKKQGQSTLGRSAGARATSLSPVPGEEEDAFEQAIHLLEFRSHQLRWHLTLESLLPIFTGQKGLKVQTIDHERVLKPEYVQTLWKGGKAKKPATFQSFTQTTDQQKYGRRTVGKITDGRYTLYVKQYPELPGVEEAVGFLTRQLLGYGAPNTLLANIEGSAYLFSEGIPGKPLHDYLTHKTDIPWPVINTSLDAESTSGMILLAMLTNPEDGKPDNYIVQERPDGTYQLVGIDNDHSFVPTASKVKGKVKMNVKSILFALEQMNEPLHHNLKRKFMYNRPGDIIREWVARLTDQAVKYNELFSQKEILSHFSKQNTFLGIALHPSIVEDLYKNLSSLQSLIQSTEDLTHLDILRNFHRTIYLRYQEGFTEHPTANPLERFKHVDGKEYKLHKKKGLQTLSTGSNLLSTNMMITTKKDLQDYVKRARGREIGLEQALKTLEEIEANDTRQLAEQAMAQAGSSIPLDHMTDGQREDFFERLDWSKLPIKNQQALIQQIARESWGDPSINKSPWRGKLTFKNCAGFTESGVFSQGNLQGMNWRDMRHIKLIIDEEGGQAALDSFKTIKKQVPEDIDLKLELKNLTLTDEDLDTEGADLTGLKLINCTGIQDPEFRQKVPGLIWREWMKKDESIRDKLRTFALEGSGQILDLKEIDIGREEVKVLSLILSQGHLKSLDLHRSFWSKIDVLKKIAPMLARSSLRVLDLGGNSINENAEAMRILASVLLNNKLEGLNLSGNFFGDKHIKILESYLMHSSLKFLNIGSNFIENEGIKSLAKVLSGSSISHLFLRYNDIRDEGVINLSLSIRMLQSLDVRDCEIGAAGAKALAEVLSSSLLQNLYLGWNEIGDEGVRALANALPTSRLQILHLAENNITDEGAKALATGLSTSQVQTLDLVYNKIGTSGAKALAEVLSGSMLQNLNLGSNEIGDEGVRALANALPTSQLQSLDVSECEIGDDQKRELQQNKERLKAIEWDLKVEKKKARNLVSNDAPQPTEFLSLSSSIEQTQPQEQEENLNLNTLLTSAGLTGEGEMPVFEDGLDRALHLVSDGQASSNASALDLIVQELGLGILSRSKGADILPAKPDLAFDSQASNFVTSDEQEFGFGGEMDIDGTLYSSTGAHQEGGVEGIQAGAAAAGKLHRGKALLDQLSTSYPKAFLSLAEVCLSLGKAEESVKAFESALNNRVPGTLEQIESVLASTRVRGIHASQLSMLLSNNYLEGLLTPVDIEKGERYLRQAVAFDPENMDLNVQLANLLIDQGGLESAESFKEINQLIDQAKVAKHPQGLSLSLMIEQIQNNRMVKDVPLSSSEQAYSRRQQRLLRALHQSQFERPSFDVGDLTEEQKAQLEVTYKRQQGEIEDIESAIKLSEQDLQEAGADKRAIESELLEHQKELIQIKERHQRELKRILFPEGVTSVVSVKDFYETLRTNIRQQLSLLDAIDAGLAERKESILEQGYKEALAHAVGQIGEMVISNAPLPASGILAMVVNKGIEMGLNKITETLQKKASTKFEASAVERRTKAGQAVGGYENNALIAEGLAAIYTYRLQNILPTLTEKSTKDLATRLAASVISYLQDKKRITNPVNLTQLATMSFYQMKGTTLGDLLKRKQGLKKIDGTQMSYTDLFSTPIIETPDGAQYQLVKEDKKNRSSRTESAGALSSSRGAAAASAEEGSPSDLVQLAPLIEKDILQNKQLTKKKTLTETTLPKLSPAQVAIIQDHDDTDYARKALEFVQELG
jgi:hypothetical protein